MTAVFIVHTNPAEGREAEFEEWYSGRHLVEVLGLPGFVRARRYRIAEAQFAPLTDYEYVAIYEIEGDPADAMRGLRHALKAGLEVSESMAQPVLATVYEPVTDWVADPG